MTPCTHPRRSRHLAEGAAFALNTCTKRHAKARRHARVRGDRQRAQLAALHLRHRQRRGHEGGLDRAGHQAGHGIARGAVVDGLALHAGFAGE
ncbi:hypothetical protein G6F50_016554 [Rhizopus delemar]|uniref:Uncharacterized protein n=1 Tax=Rhizopus delemar TaxID=936053 RepID=A0A9P6XT95_9FUNG|nr:hypothetical protein G6F50_016554 [Rhizopus delemar]